MTAGQADETLLAQLRDRVAQRVTDWRPGALVRGVSPLTGGTSSLTFLVDLAGVARGGDPGRAQGRAARARPSQHNPVLSTPSSQYNPPSTRISDPVV